MIHGDCEKELDQIPSDSVDFVLTSPPYPGVNYMKASVYDGMHWGDLYKPENFAKAHTFLSRIWDKCIRVLKPGCKLAINIANTKRRPYLPNTHKIYEWAMSCDDIECLGEIIWDKGFGQCGTAWGSFRSPADISLADQHEYILIFRKIGKRNKPASFEKIGTHDFKSWRHSIWRISPAKASKVGHVASFPEELVTRMLSLYTFEGETVLDPFAGIGTTGVVATRMKREFIGIEKDERYCNAARERIEVEKTKIVLF